MTYPNLTEEQSKRVQEFSRAQVDAMCAYIEAERRITELERENAKLRELATETMRLMQTNGPDCGLCKHYNECWAGDAMNYSPSGCVICNEARELGVEVPE